MYLMEWIVGNSYFACMFETVKRGDVTDRLVVFRESSASEAKGGRAMATSNEGPK